ncbi:winged helix-turn-helix transcriptional regulator [Actinophytocola sp.]|uniref:winged helix-turn-helix transcriptional regulator n=1 Tax=Actinophytocola sp. TaxID=1872138 RepID=UPI002ED3DD65
MTESAWKVVMDGDGLTISGESFSLTTNSSDADIDSVVSQLQGVARGTYGQYCGLSRAIEAVGERWGMLVVRDLLVTPKSAPELQRGLPRVPLNLLSMRIRELAYTGILEKDGTTDADGQDRYRLTTYGRRLEDILLAFGRWGSAMLAEPRPEDIVTEDSLMVAMRAAFVSEAAAGRSERFELVFGDIVIHVVVEDGQLEVGRGPLPGAPSIDPGPYLKDMLTRAMSLEEGMATGTVHTNGDPKAMERLLSLFALPYQALPQRSML